MDFKVVIALSIKLTCHGKTAQKEDRLIMDSAKLFFSNQAF